MTKNQKEKDSTQQQEQHSTYKNPPPRAPKPNENKKDKGLISALESLDPQKK